MSLVEDRQIELAEARRVAEHVNFDDLSVSDGEAHDKKQLSARKPRNAGVIEDAGVSSF